MLLTTAATFAYRILPAVCATGCFRPSSHLLAVVRKVAYALLCLQAMSAGKKAVKAQQQLTTEKDQLLQELHASRQQQAAADAKAQQLAADLASAEQKWLELQFLCEKVRTADGLEVNGCDIPKLPHPLLHKLWCVMIIAFETPLHTTLLPPQTTAAAEDALEAHPLLLFL